MLNVVKNVILFSMFIFLPLNARALEVDAYNNQTCAADRINQTLNCTAGEFTSTQ
jgi:hypothetical protein